MQLGIRKSTQKKAEGNTLICLRTDLLAQITCIHDPTAATMYEETATTLKKDRTSIFAWKEIFTSSSALSPVSNHTLEVFY